MGLNRVYGAVAADSHRKHPVRRTTVYQLSSPPGSAPSCLCSAARRGGPLHFLNCARFYATLSFWSPARGGGLLCLCSAVRPGGALCSCSAALQCRLVLAFGISRSHRAPLAGRLGRMAHGVCLPSAENAQRAFLAWKFELGTLNSCFLNFCFSTLNLKP